MPVKLGKFQTMPFTAKYFKGMAKTNHLGSLLQMKPQRATDTMVELLAYNKGKTLFQELSKLPTKEFETDDDFYWDVIGSARRNISLVEARDEDGNVITDEQAQNGKMVGAGTTPFYLVFAEDWFGDNEVIVGNLNELYQFRILDEFPRMEGSNAVYKVELMGGNINGVPADRLLAGEKFSVETAYIERELSRKAGTVRFATPTSLRNEWSQIRIHHKVPGSQLDRKLAVGLPIAKQHEGDKTKGNVIFSWMHYVEYELEQQFQEYKANAIFFGRSNRDINGEYHNIGKSGTPIKTGDGLFAQMEAGNTMYYNEFSLKLLTEALYDISAGSGNLGFGNRTFIIRTGERGAIQFHQAIMKEMSGWTAFDYNADALGVVKKTTAAHTGPTQALAIGAQFTEYFAPNGVHVKLEVSPWYDDPIRNKITKNGRGPAMSYRYDIMDLGTSDQQNIFICKRKGQDDYRGYMWGLRNPWTGAMGNPNMAFDEDSAEFHRMSAPFGVCILDPTRTMSLIPSELQG